LGSNLSESSASRCRSLSRKCLDASSTVQVRHNSQHAVVLRRCRRGLIEKVATEEQRREEAEDELQYQIHQRQQLQREQAAPETGVYEDINMEADGYAIPNYMQSDKSGRSGYEQLPESTYTKSLPPVDNISQL